MVKNNPTQRQASNTTTKGEIVTKEHEDLLVEWWKKGYSVKEIVVKFKAEGVIITDSSIRNRMQRLVKNGRASSRGALHNAQKKASMGRLRTRG